MSTWRRWFCAVSVFFILPHAWGISTQGHVLMYAGPTEAPVAAVQRVAELRGNVVDAAVAVALTLSVTSPYFASLGGGGFAMVKMKDSVEALDFREVAPASAGRDYFKGLSDSASITGGRAVGVPGIPAGLWALHQKYGKLNWALLFDQALKLTDRFYVSGEWVTRTTAEKARFNPMGRTVFFKKDGSAYRPGEALRQPRIGLALREFRNRNVRGFYSGAVAQDIVGAVKAAGGALTMQDMAAYKVRWLKPLVSEFNGYKLFLMPPPSSGGVVIQTALALIEKLKLKDKALLSVDELHLLAEIEKRSFRGRTLLGDPDFVKNPIEMLTSSAYVDEMAKSINLKKAVELKPLAEPKVNSPAEKSETTHFSVMDANGNAVAMTVTLNGTYGSGVVSPKFGIVLNNEMDDFTTKPGEANMFGLVQGEANSVQGGKRPLSSMSPTIVEKNGRTVLALGAPGGPRIISGVLQALYRVLGQNLDVDLAVQTPRVHHQFLPNTVYVDPNRLPPETLQALRDRGHKIEESWGSRVTLVRLRPDGVLEAAFDNRGEGGAGGF